MRPNPQETADLVTFTREILNGKPYFLWSDAIANLPMILRLMEIRKLQYLYSSIADDLNAAGQIDQLEKWWDELYRLGPQFGYYPEVSKFWLMQNNWIHLQTYLP